MRFKDFFNLFLENMNTISLNDIYDGEIPDSDELIWNFVGENDFDVQFTIKSIEPEQLKEIVLKHTKSLRLRNCSK